MLILRKAIPKCCGLLYTPTGVFTMRPTSTTATICTLDRLMNDVNERTTIESQRENLQVLSYQGDVSSGGASYLRHSMKQNVRVFFCSELDNLKKKLHPRPFQKLLQTRCTEWEENMESLTKLVSKTKSRIRRHLSHTDDRSVACSEC